MFKLFRLATLVHLCMSVLNMWFFPLRKPLKPPITPAAEMRELQRGDDYENPDESQMRIVGLHYEIMYRVDND